MCAGCVEAVRKHFPDCKDEDMYDCLMSATCFPFGTPEQVEKNLRDAKDAGCATWQDAVNHAHDKMDEAMARLPRQEAP